jgi:hypothetical protein
LQSCTRNTIEFGDDPESSYTNIVFTDTISVSLSTVISDSFATNGATSFLVGRYKDPYLGIVAARPFIQITTPATIPSIPASAQYDSISFIFRPNHYHYGDTTRAQTFYLNELIQPITYSYNNSIYNTTNIAVASTPLGTKTIRLRPVLEDSVQMRLNDSFGAELFSKLRNQSTDVTSSDNFLNYFKGVTLSTGVNDTTAVYGVRDSMVMRLYYHTTIPYPAPQSVDFLSLTNSYAFNQILPDRSGTGLISNGTGVTEIKAAKANDQAFMQAGTGLYLKLTFPTLKSILATDKVVKLVKAELYVRPSYLSFDQARYPLPSPIYMAQTDASNIVGASVVDSTGSAIQYAFPSIDNLYGEDNYYRFNVTNYISSLLASTGSANSGFFVIRESSLSGLNVDRMVVNSPQHGGQHPKLLLYLIIVNK